jgi:hypothetical protein
MPTPARKPALAAAAIFAALALLIAKLALAPLGAADLLGISACAAAAGAFATLAFTLRTPATENPGLSATDLERITAALIAAEAARRAEQQAAIAATTPARVLDVNHLSAPSARAKPRLGRGLLGLMQSPSALAAATKPDPRPAASSDSDNDRTAACSANR